eukprot:TRINITY_DN5457_c0_g1_i1.p1 TRINITY_DN5457_c0_g1~~TRINITY_DN5457_c0_g1_i1.p1  ORF type:complete len:853 (+),score=109.80 TRINITY_DN5457_c0_g1_i1:585-3143(+)
MALKTSVTGNEQRSDTWDENRCAQNEIEAAKSINLSLDLVTAAKIQLQFVKAVSNMPWLHHGPLLLRSVRRYKQFWMPLIAELGEQQEALLPPLDIQWVWHCHCLNPVAYREYCLSHFSKIIDRPALFNSAEEAEALQRCKRIWSERFPFEPFDLRIKPRLGNETTSIVHPMPTAGMPTESNVAETSDLVGIVSRQSRFYSQQVYGPHMREIDFLMAAKERYKCFLHLINKHRGSFRFVPAPDIILIWTTHQSFPVAYTRDVEWMEGVYGGAAMERAPHVVPEEDIIETARIWEATYEKPYERAGATLDYHKPKPVAEGSMATQKTIYWEYHDSDVNRSKHHTLHARHVMEICIFSQIQKSDKVSRQPQNMFLRLRAVDSFKKLKLDKPLKELAASSLKWKKLWTLQCEVNTKGIIVELRHRYMAECTGPLLRGSRLLDKVVILWNEALHSPSLSIEKCVEEKSKVLPSKNRKMIRIMASVTPPIQAPYLLKCVPDRVTDDSGAMLSDLVLRMNKYRPQEGRWISRTVLNHSGKECFVVRMRVARGIWRRTSGDRPIGVDWNERVIQVCEGSWNYLAGAVGIAPEKVVGTANPIADDLQHHRMTWALSTGENLTIQMPIEQLQWERHLQFTLKNTPKGRSARLLNGRKLQYQVNGAKPEEEEGFVTLVRHTTQCPQGKATALFNWKVSAMEFLPEEDAVLVLLLCNAIVRTVADFGGENLGNFFIRRRMKEAKPRSRDWGSVVLQNCDSTPEMSFWYLNPRKVLGIPKQEEHPPPLNSEEETHVYRSGSWLYPVDPSVVAGGSSSIRKVSSFGGDYGVGVSSSSTQRSRSGVPVHRSSPSVDHLDVHLKYKR